MKKNELFGKDALTTFFSILNGGRFFRLRQLLQSVEEEKKDEEIVHGKIK